MSVFFAGMLISVVLYPVLHEAGHFFLAVALRVEIIELTWYPDISILFSSAENSQNELILVGYGGLIFPAIAALLPENKAFFGWYVSFLLKVINLIAMGFSIYSLLSFKNGYFLMNDDISSILSVDSGMFLPTFYLTGCTFLIMLVKILHSEPVKRFDSFLFPLKQ